jgi:hypothetical protein
MKDVDLAIEIDMILDIIWDGTSRVPCRVEEGFELKWEVRFIDVLRQLV